VINKVKKCLLFVIDSLDVAGAEKSLVTLLSMLDYSRFTVDLQLFAYGHVLEDLIPKEVNLLQALKYTDFSQLSFLQSIKQAATKREYNMFYSRIKYSTKIRNGTYSNPEKAIIFWNSISNVIEKNKKVYDVAISYAQGVPTYYVADKIHAKKKIAWVNVSHHPNEMVQAFQRKYYDQYDEIVAVSDSTREVILESFPKYEDKVKILYDINNPEFISQMAKMGSGFGDDFEGVRILTIGRLAHQKGYDVALEACKQLKEEGIHFRWYVLGKGPLEEGLKRSISEMGLADHFILLGVRANPYPYIKGADIYVQTSRFEGFGLAIAEARILNIPVVTTKFDAVYNQMIHGKNGLVVDRNATAVSQGIKSLLHDQNLKQNIINYLHAEKKGNTEEIKGFYQLIN
jgi:glycosyltransferase involved in cell wall biosynthesis